ncbi:hypothetical protein IscW_ISCW020668 [Ixodes scapularis]|uniref:Uncharacterized protein n=1 Tax=Ixodes scapularis TaxID=6945 RepID=B7Q2Q9_IXOSC|nr:hypothetical protein IscW_ISCW020668 [Ixodes scapularis]|eukprot:XP_002410939.1 hypothetical protein IscW_ISCW020668 [Ixodes scapularis]
MQANATFHLYVMQDFLRPTIFFLGENNSDFVYFRHREITYKIMKQIKKVDQPPPVRSYLKSPCNCLLHLVTAFSTPFAVYVSFQKTTKPEQFARYWDHACTPQ